jgi:hypothetical protein
MAGVALYNNGITLANAHSRMPGVLDDVDKIATYLGLILAVYAVFRFHMSQRPAQATQRRAR